MADAGRDDHDIAGLDLEDPALGAAELDAPPASCDAEHLVDGRVVVLEVVNAVDPAIPPAVAGEQPVDRCFRIPFPR